MKSKAQLAAEAFGAGMTRHVQAAREMAGWTALAFVQAIDWEGDMGMRSSAYTWESAWALANPAPDDLARETA